jgi:putative ABC transport system permease protein
MLAPEIDTSVLVDFVSAERFLDYHTSVTGHPVPGQPTMIYVRARNSQVGAVGVASTMIISVLERRSEIGLRRALGATREQIRTQFLTESILLSLAGGAVGIMVGVLATIIYATAKNWAVAIPPLAWGGGVASAVIIGAIAGLLPALRAARLSPTEALRTV